MKKRKRNLILGILAMILCMVGDWLLDVKGSGNVTYGIVESNWINMSMWRFQVSILIGSLIVPFYYVAIKEVINMIKENSNTFSKTNKIMIKVFSVGALAGVISWVFIHIMCCLFPIIFKCAFQVLPDFNVVKDLVNTIAEYIYVPFFIYFLISDGGLSIAYIYFVIKKQFNVSKIAILCCPLFTLLISTIIDMIPVLCNITGAFETLGHVLMLTVAYICCVKNEKLALRS